MEGIVMGKSFEDQNALQKTKKTAVQYFTSLREKYYQERMFQLA
jgi:hypothetical protein